MGSKPQREYAVELQAREIHKGPRETMTMCPKLVVLEGQSAMVSFDDHEAVLATAAESTPRPGRSGGMVHVQVSGEDDGKINLDLNVQQTTVEKCGKEGIQMVSHAVHVLRPMSLGKPTRVVFDRDTDGKARRWLVVTVQRVSEDALPMPTACHDSPLPAPPCLPAQPVCQPGDAMEVHTLGFEVLANLLGWLCPREVEGMTLPSPHYLAHPPQYMPPSPAFPLTRELAAQEPLPNPPLGIPVARVCPTYPQPMPAPAPVATCATTTPTAMPPQLHIAVQEGQPCLEITCGGSSLCMACRKMDLKMPSTEALMLAVSDGQVQLSVGPVRARANTVTTDQKDMLLLEGKVQLHFCKDGKCTDVNADRIEVSLHDGTLKIKP
jgi:hypothetical protein